jgi:hypothetical protein
MAAVVSAPMEPDWVRIELGSHGPPLLQQLPQAHATVSGSSLNDMTDTLLERSVEPGASFGLVGLSAMRAVLDRSDSPGERGGLDGRRGSRGDESKLCGMELYSPLLSSLHSSLQQSLRRSITDGGFPTSFDSGAPLPQSLSNLTPAAEPAAAAVAAAPQWPVPQLPSAAEWWRPASVPAVDSSPRRQQHFPRRRRCPAPLQGHALQQLQEALKRGDFMRDTLLPVHIFLPNVRIVVRCLVTMHGCFRCHLGALLWPLANLPWKASC